MREHRDRGEGEHGLCRELQRGVQQPQEQAPEDKVGRPVRVREPQHGHLARAFARAVVVCTRVGGLRRGRDLQTEGDEVP